MQKVHSRNLKINLKRFQILQKWEVSPHPVIPETPATTVIPAFPVYFTTFKFALTGSLRSRASLTRLGESV